MQMQASESANRQLGIGESDTIADIMAHLRQGGPGIVGMSRGGIGLPRIQLNAKILDHIHQISSDYQGGQISAFRYIFS